MSAWANRARENDIGFLKRLTRVAGICFGRARPLPGPPSRETPPDP
jgi:hypothetical protein